ncbi:MAG: hypothetical protein II499_02065 [Firmicutes bacterium]|jgi:predicted RNase H-like HicB family nuclease|nr:hypothetical protein [Bacillota bacterium]
MDIVTILKQIVTTFDATAEPAGETIGEVLNELKAAIAAYIVEAGK